MVALALSLFLPRCPGRVLLAKARRTVLYVGCTLGLLAWGVASVVPAQALVRMDAESIDLALRYGLQNRGLGYSALLGNNWMEGPDGMLLNIYTPFMLLAAQAAKTPEEETPLDATDDARIEAARSYSRRIIREVKNKANRLNVKFSLAFYGPSPTFANETSAWIEGFGRGRAVRLQPVRDARQEKARQVPGGAGASAFEAINAYYFPFDDLAELGTYTLFVRLPHQPEPVAFVIKNDSIY